MFLIFWIIMSLQSCKSTLTLFKFLIDYIFSRISSFNSFILLILLLFRQRLSLQRTFFLLGLPLSFSLFLREIQHTIPPFSPPLKPTFIYAYYAYKTQIYIVYNLNYFNKFAVYFSSFFTIIFCPSLSIRDGMGCVWAQPNHQTIMFLENVWLKISVEKNNFKKGAAFIHNFYNSIPF